MTTATTTACRRTTSPSGSPSRRSTSPCRRRPGRGFFHLAAALPGRVAVPPDRDVVIGAALTAAGHDWNSSSSSDMADAADILLPLREDLVIGGSIVRRRLAGAHRRGALLRRGVRDSAARRPLRRPARRHPRPRALLLHPAVCTRPRLGPRLAEPHARPRRRRCRDALHAPGDAGRAGRLPAAGVAACKRGDLPARASAVPLTFANVTPAGALLRADLWHELTADEAAPARATVDSCGRSGSRDALGRRGKSGHRRARVPGNARTGKPDGKRNREQTADRRPSRTSRQG